MEEEGNIKFPSQNLARTAPPQALTQLHRPGPVSYCQSRLSNHHPVSTLSTLRTRVPKSISVRALRMLCTSVNFNSLGNLPTPPENCRRRPCTLYLTYSAPRGPQDDPDTTNMAGIAAAPGARACASILIYTHAHLPINVRFSLAPTITRGWEDRLSGMLTTG